MQRSELIAALRSQEYHNIGNGAFSKVYGKEGSERCIKIGQGDNWIDFILWGVKNGFNGTFTPNIFYFQSFDEYYVAIVERARCDAKEADNFSMNLITAFKIAVISNKSVVKLPVNWIDFFDKFYDYSLSVYDAEDLKPANWLIRPNGSLFLNDPVHGYRHKFKGCVVNGRVYEKPVHFNIFDAIADKPPAPKFKDVIEQKKAPKPWMKLNFNPNDIRQHRR